MITQEKNRRVVTPAGQKKFKAPAQRFLTEVKSLNLLPQLRREYIPFGLLIVLQAITGNSNDLIVFREKEDLR
jgi:hypothetical protein